MTGEEKFWPVTLSKPWKTWPTKRETQVDYIKKYRVYLTFFESNKDKDASISMLMKRYKISYSNAEAVVSFGDAVLAAMTEGDENKTTP